MGISNILIRGLIRLCALLNKNDYKYCLVGGLAVSMLTAPRATEDIDLVVAIDDTARAEFERSIKAEFEIVQSKDTFFFAEARIWRLILKNHDLDPSGLFILDIIFADNSVYTEAINGAFEVEGVVIPVVSVESLIRIKTLAGRTQDLLDIEKIKEYFG